MRVKDPQTTLRILALLLIGMLAGPEIGLAMEMTTLLEILGAAAFFLSFHVGARILLMDLGAALRSFVCPPVVSAMRRPAAIVYMATRTFWLGASGIVTASFVIAFHSGGWP